MFQLSLRISSASFWVWESILRPRWKLSLSSFHHLLLIPNKFKKKKKNGNITFTGVKTVSMELENSKVSRLRVFERLDFVLTVLYHPKRHISTSSDVFNQSAQWNWLRSPPRINLQRNHHLFQPQHTYDSPIFSFLRIMKNFSFPIRNDFTLQH